VKFTGQLLNIALIFGLVMMGLTSCLPERKVARTFATASGEINLLVIPPDYVFKYNHKGEAIENFASLNQQQQDSALWATSRFMQFVSDSLILDNYMNKFIDELRALGFKVYLDDAVDSFMTGKPQSYVIDISQMQLDEYFYPMQDEESFNDSVYYKNFNLNAVDMSCWFDLSKANTDNARKTVLFNTATSYDSFEGRFYNDPFTGAVRYKYRIDSLELKDVYAMATYLGRKHAGYLYDFFMNQYIAKHMPDGLEMQDYYHFDRQSKTIYPADDDRLEVLKNK